MKLETVDIPEMATKAGRALVVGRALGAGPPRGCSSFPPAHSWMAETSRATGPSSASAYPDESQASLSRGRY